MQVPNLKFLKSPQNTTAFPHWLSGARFSKICLTQNLQTPKIFPELIFETHLTVS